MPVFGTQPPDLLQTVVEDIGVAMVVVDREERVVFANHLAHQLLDFVSVPEGMRFRDLRSKIRVEDPSGNEIPLAEAIVIAVDETEEVDTRKAAAVLERMETIGTLAAGLTHDFNNLLNTITTNVAIVKENGGYSPEVGVRLDQISDAVNKSAGLIRRLMQFRSQDLHLRSLDVNDVVRDVVRLTKPLLRDNIGLALHQVSTTDPDSTYATKGGTPARLGYYDNYLVDNQSCVIVGVQATAARMSQETVAAQDMLARFAACQGREPESVERIPPTGTESSCSG